MSKKKLIITITSLCLVVVAAVAAVVGVVAASTQTVTSTVSVSYLANNVKATMSVTSKLQKDGDFGTTRTTTADVNFQATEGRSEKTLVVQDSPYLGNSGTSNMAGDWRFERYIIYRYAFHNDYAAATTEPVRAAEGRSMNVTLTYNENQTTRENVRVAFAFQAGNSESVPVTATTEPSGDGEIAVWNAQNVVGTDYKEWGDLSTSDKMIAVAQNETGYVYVLVAIQSPLRDASFSTNAASAFTFVLTVGTETNSHN